MTAVSMSAYSRHSMTLAQARAILSHPKVSLIPVEFVNEAKRVQAAGKPVVVWA